MRLLIAPEFSDKLTALSHDSDTIREVSRIVATIESATDPLSLKRELVRSAALEADIHVAKVGDTRVFLSFGRDGGGDYVLLLDLAVTQSRHTPTSVSGHRNPKFNSSLNPKWNASLNPKFNSALNPKFNSSINPKFNSSINPKFNPSINPRFNSSINPAFNSSINPKFNPSLNPRFNPTLNPRTNPAFPGPYIYSLDLEAEGFLVRIDDRLDARFDMDAAFQGIVVRNEACGYVIFDAGNDWVGYLVRADNDVYLRFSPDAEWTGIVV